MRQVYYFEHYPHYLGTMNATVRLTPKQFEELVGLAKKSLKGDEDAEELLTERVDEIADEQNVTVYALVQALTDYGDSPRRPSTVMSALKKKGVWADLWEEGSHAFATTERRAKEAVGKVEAKNLEIDW
jgi:hypothetical protein